MLDPGRPRASGGVLRNDPGIAECIELQTGQLVWEQRQLFLRTDKHLWCIGEKKRGDTQP